MPDPELEAMSVVHGALEPLEGPARERVLRWAAAKFEVSAGTNSGRASDRGGVQDPEGGDVPEFTDVGDLVHASGAANGPERALVVGYWFQEAQSQDGWTAAALNSTLRNMGHPLANVTKTLDSLKARKPALVMQVSKSGRARQARKTYRLTTAGLSTVRQMISNPNREAA